MNITNREVDNEYIRENEEEHHGHFVDKDGVTLPRSLEMWRERGWKAAGKLDHISGFKLVYTDRDTVKKSIAHLSGYLLVILLPRGYNYQGHYGKGHDWTDAAPRGRYQHCMLLIAYDHRNVTGITWATRQVMSWEFFERHVLCGYVVIP